MATASGQAAEFLTFACLAGAGDHIVAGAGLYGGTITQLDVTLRRFGVETTFVPAGAGRHRCRQRPGRVRRRDQPPDEAAVRRGRRPTPRARSPTSPGSPTSRTRRACRWSSTRRSPRRTCAARSSTAPTSSSTRRPSSSAGTAPRWAGWWSSPGRFDWGNGRFPQMTEPVASYGGLNWWGNFQEFGFLTKLRAEQLRDIGASLSAHSAFLLHPGRRDAAAADGGARGERARRRRVAARRPARLLRPLGRACPTTPTTTAPPPTCRSGPGAVFAFGVRGRPGRRAGGSSSRCSSAATSPTSATPARW